MNIIIEHFYRSFDKPVMFRCILSDKYLQSTIKNKKNVLYKKRFYTKNRNKRQVK
jgi:hypothetical protein